MDLRKLAIPEHFSAVSSKRKVISGFGMVFVASLLVFTVISLRGFDSSSFSWFFPIPTSSSSSTSSPAVELQKSMEPWKRRKETVGNKKANGGNSSENAYKGTYLGKEDGILQKTQEKDLPEVGKVSSFKDFGAGHRVKERTHEGENGVLKENSNRSSFSKDKEGAVEKTQGRGHDKNASFSVTKEKIAVKTHEGNISGKEEDATFPSKKERVAEKTNVGALPEKDKFPMLNNGSDSLEGVGRFSGKCNIYNGRWVRDEGKPYYPPGSCPHIDKDFDCHENGRPDNEFTRWRWQPKDCDIPSLNATDFLEKLRGKKLLFVGDSLNRNMWESLVCILRHGVVNKRRVHEASGRIKFKTKGYYSFVYEDYNCSIDFVRSPYLVKEMHLDGANGVDETLRLDLMDELIRVCQEADVLVFNTGHWWTHEKTSRGENYYQEGDHLYQKLNVKEAYKKALTTWATWVEKNIDANRTRVFFRGYSVSHFRGGQWNSGGQCKNETEPIFNETYLAKYPWQMKMFEQVLNQMRTPIVYMNISRLTDYRKDGHPSIYRKEYKTDQHTEDCSHWCLPGVPDTWNELLYASIVMAG